MKKTIFAFLTMIAAAACAPQIGDRVDLDEYFSEKNDATKSFTVLREGDLDLSDMSPWKEAVGASKATYSNLILAVSGIIQSAIGPHVHQVIGTYKSKGVNGEDLTLSGKILYPKRGKIKNMMIVSHYTIGSNAEAPSEGFSFESIYAALGYVIVIPDYIGFGETVKMPHPYLQAETTARNVIDMALAAKPFLDKRNIVPESESVILLGYSQGGATTMHVQRLLENYPEYAGKFKIKKNYAGSGPYDIARTYDYAITKDETGIPYAIPMIIQGMNIGMEKPLDMKYFFKEPLRSNYDDWLNSKKYTVSQVSALIGSHKISDILTDEGRDKSKTETFRLYQELIRNSIPEDFVPEAPIYMFHSEDDQTVPFINSQLMQRQFRIYGYSKAQYDFGHYGNHQQGAMKFILNVASLLQLEQ